MYWTSVQIDACVRIVRGFQVRTDPNLEGRHDHIFRGDKKAARVVTRERFSSRYRARYAVRYRSGDSAQAGRVASHCFASRTNVDTLPL
jgi:hypothetical protein